MTSHPSRYLLVEPQFVLRRTIVMVARDMGSVSFTEATGVQQARALLKEQAFDGLVLNTSEGQVALELLADLRMGKFQTRADAPVVALAAAMEADHEKELQALGVKQVLHNPVKIRILLEAISREG